MTGNENALSLSPAATPVTAATQGTVTELVRAILDDVQTLARQQVTMLKAEVREDMNKTRTALVYGGTAVVSLTVGSLAVVAGLILLLYRLDPAMPVWVAALLVGGLFVAAGVVLGLVARNMFESFNPLPDKTFNALQDNLAGKAQPRA